MLILPERGLDPQGEISLHLELGQLGVGYRTTLPITFLRAVGREEELGALTMVPWFLEASSKDFRLGWNGL